MEVQAVDDYRLLQSCFGGKTEDFGVIVQKYQSFICALTYSAVGDRDKSEELAQEVFILAWNNLSQLKDYTKFKNWLYHITKNHINHFFRRKKRDILSRAVSITDADPTDTVRDDPVNQVISKERQQLVWNALSQIPVNYRDPLILYYREGKSIRQVAKFFDITEVTAKKRLSRARAMIRASIEKDLEKTISSSTPDKRFSASVVGLIAAGKVVTTGSSSVAGATATVAGAKGVGWFSGLMSSMTTKIGAAVLVIAIILVTGNYVLKGESEPDSTIKMLPAELNDGMVMHLSFDNIEEDQSRIKITDESHTGNDGILLGGQLDKGKIGNALHCRAQNKSDGILVKDNASLDLDAVTIAAWIKTDLLDGQWNRILDKGWRDTYNLCIGGDYRGQKWYRNRTELECACTTITSKTAVVDNQWHLIVGTYDGLASRLYVDGKLDAEMKHKKPVPMKHNDVDIMIGILAVPELKPHDQAFFDGLIDEVRLYNRVLSSEEISTLYRYDPDD